MVQYQRAHEVAIGVGVALGLMDPGMGYFEALTNSEAEAAFLKAQHVAVMQSRKHSTEMS